MKDNYLIHEFQKNAGEKVHIQFNQYKGSDLIDIRVYYDTDNDESEWRPTRKGISIRVDLLPELLEGLQKAQKRLRK